MNPSIDCFYPNNDEKMMVDFSYKNVMKRRSSNSKVHHGKTIYVDETGCLVPRGLTYDGYIFTITSCFKTRRILQGTLINYSRFNTRIVLNTTDYGLIEFNVKNVTLTIHCENLAQIELTKQSLFSTIYDNSNLT